MLSLVTAHSERAEVCLLVAFLDLTGFALQSTRVSDAELASAVDGYYQRVAERITAAGGRVVKYIGDGALVVFDADATEPGVAALLDVQLLVDRYFEDLGWPCRATVKAHVGPVIAGPYGPPDDLRFDVIGKTVNTAAMLDTTSVALSAEAFSRLSPAMRQRFKEHTWPVTYLRVEDLPRFRQR